MSQQSLIAIAGIGYANPFLPERIELEKKALGKEFIKFSAYLQYRPECSVADMSPNSPLLRKRGEQLLEKMREKLVVGEPASDHELDVYEDLALFQLYARYMSTILDLPVGFRNRPEDDILDSYDDYVKDYRHLSPVCRSHRNAITSNPATGIIRRPSEFRAVHFQASTSRTSRRSETAHVRSGFLDQRPSGSRLCMARKHS